jgi:gamma-glutamylputrescine oxidase
MNATVRMDFGSGWYAANAPAAFERPQLTFDVDVDVCVIGGGLAGLTVAREVAQRGWSVAVLEARRVAWNASGLNCGFVAPGFGSDVRHLVERVGLEHAKALWELSAAGVEYVRTLIRDTGMPGVEPVAGWLDVSQVDNGDELLEVAALLGQNFGADVETWPTERVREALKTNYYFHAIHYPKAFHINPLNYTRGLASAALAAGATIFEETPALEIDASGVRKRIATPSARLRAAHVVLAGNVHLGPLVPRLAATVLPVMGHVAVTAPLGDRLREAMAYRGAVTETRPADNRYRIVGGDRLLWSSSAILQPRNARAVAGNVKTAIERTYPQLAPVEIEHVWTAVMGFSMHGMPQVGEVAPGLWLASAFGDHGLNTTAMAGGLIGRAITDDDDRWRLFLPYELVWAGGAAGQMVRHVSTWSRRITENIAGSLARRRERNEQEGELMNLPSAAPTDLARPIPAEAVGPLVAEVESVLHEAAQRAKRGSAEKSPEGTAKTASKTETAKRRRGRLPGTREAAGSDAAGNPSVSQNPQSGDGQP